MTVLTSITARQILDCKARPMVEVEMITASGAVGRAAAPTGQSVGIHESVVLRDGDLSEYGGASVHKAVANVANVIGPAVVGMDFPTQAQFDAALLAIDGTPEKRNLGGNATYPASVAFLRAQAAEKGLAVYEHVAREEITTFPVPCFNVINGGTNRGVHQAFNEFLIVPHGAESVQHAVEMGVSIFSHIPRVIERRTGRTAEVGSSYGYASPYSDPREVMLLLQEAVELSGNGQHVSFALDCALSESYGPETRTYQVNGQRLDNTAVVEYLKNLTEEFDLLFIEDPLDEDDWEGFSLAVKNIDRSMIFGDDLIVTNKTRLERAIDEKAVDGFVLKPNQIGTISEALETFDLASQNEILALPSGRSGGVIDDVVMDLSLGLQVPFQKNGAPKSGERIEKLNFLLRAEERIPTARIADLSEFARYSAKTS